jgi:hypothetical protein
MQESPHYPRDIGWVLCQLAYLWSDLSPNSIPLRLQRPVALDGFHWTSFKVLRHHLLDPAAMSAEGTAYLECLAGMNPIFLG